MSEVESEIEKIRRIRSSTDIKLKPSPYLRDRYVNEYGEERQVEIRGYQKAGIMNLLQIPRMLLGDDTGLGKTLIVLSAIGYVWMLEPEYVPIVITKKSSIYQWHDEVGRFMTGMDVTIVDGEPYERDKIYEEFFRSWTEHPEKKRLIALTYDVLLKDAKQNVVRDRTEKPSLEIRKAFKVAKQVFQEKKDAFDSARTAFSKRFENREGFELHEYLRLVLAPKDADAPDPVAPSSWTEEDASALTVLLTSRNELLTAKSEKELLKDSAEPPKTVPGFIARLDEFRARSSKAKIMLVMDEMHVLKNYRGKIHEVAAEVAHRAERVIGMTATPVKNRLMEFFGLLRIINPWLFPKISHFHGEYCIVKLQDIGGGRKVPIVVGHSKEQLDKFVQKIEPFYLSRRKHEVAKELPELVTRELICELSDEQQELYDLAELGLLNTGSDADAERAEILKSMTMIQQAANAPQLLVDEEGDPYEGESSKITVLMDLLQEELEGVKTIVFSRFEKMISLIGAELESNKIKYVRITGKETDAKKRIADKDKFQNLKSGIDVILITTAGSESLNLHAAEHIVFGDNPWSWGDYLQLTGRSIRIGSIRKVVMATHLVARKQGGGKTIDDHVMKILRGKKALADKVAGEALPGGLQFSDSDEAMDIFRSIREERMGRVEASQAIRGMRAKASTKAKVKAKAIAEQPPAKAVIPSVDLSDLLSDI